MISRIVQQYLFIILSGIAVSFITGSESRAADAQRIRKTAGFKGGLVVVVGCEDVSLLTDLYKSGRCILHGVDTDRDRVIAARKKLRGKSLYGPISVSTVRDGRIPFVDNLVNMIVINDEAKVSKDELMPALAPDGTIVDIRKAQIKIAPKKRPQKIDQWSHFLHDASNNAVSGDSAVGPPKGLRWTCGPKYSRSHEHFASMNGMVTADGKVYYIMDEGPIRSVYLPPDRNLVARDAFSGVLLWKKPVKKWESHLRGFRSGPPEIGRRLVADRDRLYVALDYGEPVVVLDGATGKQSSVLKGTEGARELIINDGVVYVIADDMTVKQHDKLNKWIEKTVPEPESWYRFPQKAKRLYGTPRIIAFDADEGGKIWEKNFKNPGQIMPATLAASGGRVCYQTVTHVVCVDAANGNEIWRADRPVAVNRPAWSTPTLVIYDDVVLSLDRMPKDNHRGRIPEKGSTWIINSGGGQKVNPAEIVAFSLEKGKKLWKAPCTENYNTPGDIFVINGVVWTGELRRGEEPGFTKGRDPKTGKVIATIPPQKGWGHHHCYRNRATTNWILVGRGGLQFINIKTGKWTVSSIARGSCQYGVMPANGLLYVPQHSCACNPEILPVGFNTFSPRSNLPEKPATSLMKGPAYGYASNIRNEKYADQWPTYRCDVGRHGFQNMTAPSNPKMAWTKKLIAPITPPVVAKSMVFVAERQTHTLHAMSSSDGSRKWKFVADGRIDSPPSIYGGLCVFGTRNGFVYCLKASDGSLAWKFRAASSDLRLFSYEQLESVWPVHGSVLIDDNLSGGQPRVYFGAGRSSHVDGGIRLYALDLKSGKVIHNTRISKQQIQGGIRQRIMPDILTISQNAIWMRTLGVDKNLKHVSRKAHFFAPRGFLDDTWWHRTYWIYGTKMLPSYGGWYKVGNTMPAGRLLVFDNKKNVYGYGRMSYRAGGGHVGPDLAKSYKLFAEKIPSGPVDARDEKTKRQIKWTADTDYIVRSMVLVRDGILLAGAKTLKTGKEDGVPGLFEIASPEDGSRKTWCKLPAPPVLDGMAAVTGSVYISTTNGAVSCYK